MSYKVIENDWMTRGPNSQGFEKIQRFADLTLREMWRENLLPNPLLERESRVIYFSNKYLVVNINGDKTLEMHMTVKDDDGKIVPVTFTFNAGISFAYYMEDEEDRWGYYVDDCWVNAPLNINVKYDNAVTDEEQAEIMSIFYSVIWNR